VQATMLPKKQKSVDARGLAHVKKYYFTKNSKLFSQKDVFFQIMKKKVKLFSV
jgi:hypothetical protein